MQVSELELLQSHLRALHDTPLSAGVESLAQNRAHLPLLDKLGALFDNASVAVKKALGLVKIPTDPISLDALVTKLNALPYLELADIPVHCIPNQSVSYLQYAQAIKECQDVLVNLYDYTLYPFQLYLGDVLNHPERLQNTASLHQIRTYDLNKYRKLLGDVQRGKSELLPYGKLVSRHADWQAVAKLTSQLVTTQKKIPQDLVEQTVLSIDERLNELFAKINDSNNQYRPSPQLVKQLGDLCYALADHVLFYSVYATQLQLLVNGIKASEKNLYEILSD